MSVVVQPTAVVVPWYRNVFAPLQPLMWKGERTTDSNSTLNLGNGAGLVRTTRRSRCGICNMQTSHRIGSSVQFVSASFETGIDFVWSNRFALPIRPIRPTGSPAKLRPLLPRTPKLGAQ